MPTQGFLSLFGAGKESTWGTGVLVTNTIPALNFDLHREAEPFISEVLNGAAGRKYKDSACGYSALGSVQAELIVDKSDAGIEQLIAGALGVNSWDATNGVNKYYMGSSGDVIPSFTFAGGTLSSNDDIYKEMQGGKIKTLKISGKAGESVKIDAEMIGKDVLISGDSGIVNDNITQMGVPAHYYRLCDLEVLLGSTSATLSSANEVSISEFEISLDNKLTDPEFASNSRYTLEPEVNGFRELSVSITLPREDAIKAYRDALAAATDYQMQLKFSYGSYYFNIMIPLAILKTHPEQVINGAGIIPVKLDFEGLFNLNTNTNMKFTDGSVVNGLIGVESKSERTAIIS